MQELKTISSQATKRVEGSTTIESIAQEKNLCEEVSRVGVKQLRSAEHLL